MGLRNKLEAGAGSTFSRGNGVTPTTPVGATPQSKLHYEYSVNGDPYQPFKPTPSTLDLNGTTPSNNYRDNAPEGASF